MRLEEMTFEQIYLEYYNNFATIERMAEYYNVPFKLLSYWVEIGKNVNNKQDHDQFTEDINKLYLNII